VQPDPSPPSQAARKTIDEFLREHRDVTTLLVMLDSYFASMKLGDDVDDPLLLDAMSYLSCFLQGVHHAKEDLAVEAAIDRVPAIRELCGELAAQHRRIRDAGAQLHDELQGVLLDAPILRRALADDGFAYTAEIRRNMALEEEAVFPALSEALDADMCARIDARLPRRDALFGAAGGARYEKLFHELTSRFGCEGEPCCG
jgi:hemerythrin-like domain-containing protein